MKFKAVVLFLLLQTVICKNRKPKVDDLKLLRYNGGGARPQPQNSFDEIQSSIMNTLEDLGQSGPTNGPPSTELDRLLGILKNIDELKMDLDYFKELIERRIIFEKEKQEMDAEINDILSTISNKRKSKKKDNYNYYN